MPPLTISNPYSCLRILLRSVRVKVHSKPVQRFVQRRVIESWREHRNVTDPIQQKALMDRAATAIAVLHLDTKKPPKPGAPIDIKFD